MPIHATGGFDQHWRQLFCRRPHSAQLPGVPSPYPPAAALKAPQSGLHQQEILAKAVDLVKRSAVRWGIVSLAATAAFLATNLVGIQLTGNFHSVVQGKLYRSGQPSAADIAAYARDYGLKTIINLRGASDANWYRDEVAAAKKAGIRLIDFKMNASDMLPVDRSQQLIALLRNAQGPILVHCKSGADRTGLVSVIYLQQIAGVDEETAEEQLSIRYGHIGIPFLSPTFSMDETWEGLEQVFGLPS